MPTGGGRIGTIIRDHRLALGLGQEAVAATLGVNQQDISRWERHQTRPQPEHFDRLAAWLGWSRADLILAIHQAEPATDPVDVLADRLARLEDRLAGMEATLVEVVDLLRGLLGRGPGGPSV